MGYFQWLVSPVKNIQLIWNLTNYLKLSCFLQVYTEGYLEPSLKINFLFQNTILEEFLNKNTVKLPLKHLDAYIIFNLLNPALIQEGHSLRLALQILPLIYDE